MCELKLIPNECDTYKLAESFIFHGRTIPKGFITNGANVPRIFWSIYPPNYPKRMAAVVLHDFLCDNAYTKKDYKEADIALRDALIETGSGKVTATLFYIGCRLYHIIKYRKLPKE